jgi:hypothetical protein
MLVAYNKPAKKPRQTTVQVSGAIVVGGGEEKDAAKIQHANDVLIEGALLLEGEIDKDLVPETAAESDEETGVAHDYLPVKTHITLVWRMAITTKPTLTKCVPDEIKHFVPALTHSINFLPSGTSRCTTSRQFWWSRPCTRPCWRGWTGKRRSSLGDSSRKPSRGAGLKAR